MSNREALLEATRAARDARKAEKVKDAAAVKVQCAVRGWLTRIRMKREWQGKIDNFTAAPSSVGDGGQPSDKKEFDKKSTAAEMYELTRGFILHVHRSQAFYHLCT